SSSEVKHHKVGLIEMKISNYKMHKSIDKLKAKGKKKIGQSYVLYAKDVKAKDDIIYLPVYMAMFL
ncbi:MAG: hypothetical protein RR660_11325, partial [Anaerorhabdus sp.]